MRSVLLDNSFCLRLVNDNDAFHQNAKDYFNYFLDNQITMYLSNITFAEYCVVNSPQDFPLKQVRTLTFDMRDATKAGEIWNFVHYQKLAKDTTKTRDAIKDDCKLFAQICNREIDAFVSKDKKSYEKYIQPISEHTTLKCKFDFIDLTIPPENYFQLQGSLF
jgi:predicted nucleic acid-binding protein